MQALLKTTLTTLSLGLGTLSANAADNTFTLAEIGMSSDNAQTMKIYTMVIGDEVAADIANSGTSFEINCTGGDQHRWKVEIKRYTSEDIDQGSSLVAVEAALNPDEGYGDYLSAATVHHAIEDIDSILLQGNRGENGQAALVFGASSTALSLISNLQADGIEATNVEPLTINYGFNNADDFTCAAISF